MSVRPQDMERALENAKKASNWENKLVSANNLFHQGSSQYSAAVNQYGKIVEILLRHFFQEISLILPPKDRTGFLQLEGQIGRGRPFGNFGLGQMIDFFSKAGIFTLLNNFLREYVEEIFNYEDLVTQAASKKINPFWFYENIEEARIMLDAIRNDTLHFVFLGCDENRCGDN